MTDREEGRSLLCSNHSFHNKVLIGVGIIAGMILLIKRVVLSKSDSSLPACAWCTVLYCTVLHCVVGV